MGREVMESGLCDLVEHLSLERRNVIVTVLEGNHAGYHCIVNEEGCVWENSRTAGEDYERLKKEAGEVMKSCCREIDGEKVLFEVLSGTPKLIVCGGGHVAAAVVSLAKFLNFYVTVIEDRILYADRARQAGADEVICDSFEHGLEGILGDGDTYFVIVTRGHRFDKVCLEAILKKKYAYVGMMGSRSRVKALRKVMEEEGFSAGKLQELHAPIGLSISSETPEEIAVSVMGEIIGVKNQSRGTEGFTGEIQKALYGPGRRVLATIAMRKGSAPRKIGTRMVIAEDGTLAGTIGGGCAEAEVAQAALQMIRSKDRKPRMIRINMTNQDAEEEGMVCGGIQDIFLEAVSE